MRPHAIVAESSLSPPILVNGKPDPVLSVLDRGFQYGDGVFTTLPVRRGIPELPEQHLRRLARDAGRLGFAIPDPESLREDMRRLLAQGVDGVLKIQVTRGCGGRGYLAPEAPVPSRILGLYPLPSYPAELSVVGVSVRICQTALGCNPALAGIKHMNRLEQVLARSEWREESVREGLLCDQRGRLVEGTMSNVFLVRGNRLVTPVLDGCGVAGVIRELLLSGASEMGLVAEERDVAMAEVFAADEAFLTNSVIRLWPIRRLEGHEIPLGSVAKRAGQWLSARIHQESIGWSS